MRHLSGDGGGGRGDALRVTRAGGGTGTVAAAAATYQLLTTRTLTRNRLVGDRLARRYEALITGTNLGPLRTERRWR